MSLINIFLLSIVLAISFMFIVKVVLGTIKFFYSNSIILFAMLLSAIFVFWRHDPGEIKKIGSEYAEYIESAKNKGQGDKSGK